MSESRKYNTGALFIFPLVADGANDFVSDYTPAAGDAKVWTDKLISTNLTSLILGFDSLSELPTQGAQLDENGAGTAEGIIEFTIIISGTVGGGDAAGFFIMRSVAGQAWSNNDQIDINGGTANIATADSTTYDLAATAGLIGSIGNGLFAAALSPTEMTCSLGAIYIIDSATKAIEDQAILFSTFGNASALQAMDFDDAVRGGMTALPNAAAEASGGLYTRGTGAGQINQANNGEIDADVARWVGTAVSAGVGGDGLPASIALADRNAFLIESLEGGHTYQGNHFYVDPVNGDTHASGNRGGRTDPYKTIQDCHDNAVTDSNHDVVFLVAGHASTVTTHTIAGTTTLWKRYLSIRGPGRDFIITRTGSGDTLAVTGDGIALSGFQLGTAATGSGHGIKITDADFAKIQHVWILDTQGDGVHILRGSNCVIDLNTFAGTGVGGTGQGVHIVGTAGVSTNNRISANVFSETAGDSILIEQGTTNDTLILRNIIHDSSAWGINIGASSTDAIVHGNIFGNNSSGNITDAGTTTVAHHNRDWLSATIEGRSLGVESDGDLTKVNILDGHTAQTGDSFARIAAPAGVSVSADIAAVKTAADAIPTTAMRGTDSASLASVCTEPRLAELDAANLPTDVAAIPITAMRGTDNAATAAALATVDGIVDAILVDTATTIPALIAALNNLSAANVNAECDTAISDAALATAAALATVDGIVDATLVETAITLPAILATLATAANLATVDTVVDAIKVITDALPDSGALTTIGTATARLTAVRAAILTDWIDAGRLDVILDAIKTVVDRMNLGIVVSTTKAGTLSTTQSSTNLTQGDDQLIGRIITFTSGVLTDESSDILDFSNINGVLTYTAMTQAAGVGDSFKIT